MPAPNDLTPEDEAEFAKHGIPTAGPGREPLSEAPIEQQQSGQQSGEQSQQRQTFHRDDGTFASREEREQGQARPGGGQQQQGQQQQGQEQQGQEQQGQEQQGQEQQGQEQQGGGEPKMVPLAALHQERQRIAAVAQRAQLAETRLNAILARQATQQPTEQAMPDINENPAGYIVALEERLKRFEDARNEETQFRQIDQAISADESTFKLMHADYDAASDHYVKSRAQELLSFYPPEQAQKIMLGEARSIAQEAWQRGKSVGEMIYNLAQARGYNPNAPVREPQNQQQGQGQQSGPSATDVVESITRGQAASRSLSGGAGVSAENLNADALLKMDDNEFAAWLGEGPTATKRFAAIG